MTNQLSMFDAPAPTAPAPVNLSTCSLIYEPKGRAREYAALACNVYRGCDHGCVYCYAPDATQRRAVDFIASTARAGDFLRKLDQEAAKYQAAGVRTPVHLCFTCDPYQHLDETLRHTRQAIQVLHRHGLPVAILTKGGTRAIRDRDLLTKLDTFATTLTLLDQAASLEWEPGATVPADRITAISYFHERGIPTWVSLEPVIDPAVTLEIIRRTAPIVDLFKVGKMNYHPIAKTVDWAAFAHSAIQLLTSLGYERNTDPDNLKAGQFYVKRDLAAFIRP